MLGKPGSSGILCKMSWLESWNSRPAWRQVSQRDDTVEPMSLPGTGCMVNCPGTGHNGELARDRLFTAKGIAIEKETL